MFPHSFTHFLAKLAGLLPVAGLCVGMLYQLYGKSTDGGNNLLVD
jgi:hypothetical protein